MTLKQRDTWIRIIVYFIIATALSNVFRLGLFDWYNTLSLPFGLTIIIKTLLEGIGPITGAVIIFSISKKAKLFSLLGSQKEKSLIMAFIPILLFTFFGADNDFNLNRHYYGFVLGFSLVMYGVFEEFGWRGYLQNELVEFKPLLKALIIGSIWYLWHLSFISTRTDLLNELKFFLILVFASWGIGAIAEKTKSIVASACFHIIGNIITFSSLLSTSVDSKTRYIIFGICLTSWILIVNTWDKWSAQTANSKQK